MRLRLVSMLILTATLAACASGGTPASRTAAAAIRGAPRWYGQTTRGNRYVEGRATSVSRDMQLSVDNAAAEARVQIAQEIETFVGATLERATQQSGEVGNETATRTSNEVVRQVSAITLRSMRIDRQEITPEPDGRFRAWVRMRVARNQVQAALESAAQREQVLYERIRNTEAFREVAAEAAAYRADSSRVR